MMTFEATMITILMMATTTMTLMTLMTMTMMKKTTVTLMTTKLMERNWLQQRSAQGSSSGREHYQSSFQFSVENNLIIRSRPLSFSLTFLIFLPCLVYLSLLESLTKYLHYVPLTDKDSNLIKYLMTALIQPAREALRALGLLLYSRIPQWEGGRLFDRSAGFFYGNSCNSGTESRKIVPKVGN